MSITAEKITKAIRSYCEDQSPKSVQISSDGIERIYYAGISLSGLTDAIFSLLQQGEPEGWKLVRRELTGEQMAAAASVLVEEYNLAAPDDCDRLQEMWEAMLSASPLPPAPGAETGERKGIAPDPITGQGDARSLDIKRDWCIEAARHEGDVEVGVGYNSLPEAAAALSSRQAVLEEAHPVWRGDVRCAPELGGCWIDDQGKCQHCGFQYERKK